MIKYGKAIAFSFFVGMFLAGMSLIAYAAELQQQPVQQQKQPKGQLLPEQPVQQQKQPKGQLLPDLVISSVKKLGYVKPGEFGVEFTIVNNGPVASGRAGSAFSVGASYVPQIVKDCTPPPCSGNSTVCGQLREAYLVRCKSACGFFDSVQTYSFSFSPPIIVSTPMVAGEIRTIIGRLKVPGCLQYSANGKIAMVSLKVDDANQVNERNEDNNSSAPISVQWE